ncbi:ABC transporter permease [Haloglomus litoreum]|uniref:ABC transporter permease n=1 Tax=Haloglomus litoreum TaxID=3034026 RepID=UPI0023E8BB2E|nr:ABC transporter permease [Haloglomus sp. DT116]
MVDQNAVRGGLKYAIYRTPLAVMFLGFYVPLLSLVVFSFWERSGLWMEPAFTLAAYETLFSTNIGQLGQSLTMGLTTGLVALVLAFPVAYLVSFISTDFQRMVFLSIFAVPFFVSPFVRILLLVPILGADGVVNTALLTVGLIDEPLGFLLFTNFSVLIGTLVSFMPFVIFTGWLSMEMIDDEMKQAAEDLGARPLTTIRTVIGPLALPGILVGVLFVIAASMGEAIFPRVLGGTDAVSIGLMTQRAFSQLNVPFAAATTVVALSLYVVGLVVITRYVSLDELFTAFQEEED